ncbi:energy transducer TonB [Phenylobacterium sp.]|uniref:energy transducer TonB n=1 Tax=Phenylobacterium sp. TaxID=1871053 RepID=UPI0025EDEEC1|nr:energy transducer TonB [Phenylobacterium sp.]MBX3484606.1 energy transducer TonB [Phenylobacterium sp.]MCW5759640.1 energy transducer TonB [Phenylobacterium sp.]
MTSARARRFEMNPAAVGSLVLHVAVAAAFMIQWGNRNVTAGSVVPVTIVANAPSEPRPAEQAPVEQEAQTEAPVAEAPPEPAPPPPPPTPAPAPTPTPKAAKPVEKAPAPTPAPKTRPVQKSLDLDALSASLTPPARNAPQRPSSAPKGATRPTTAPVARATNGFGATSGAAVSSSMQDELERNWSIDCSLASTRDVVVRTHFTIGAGGRLVGDVTVESRGGANEAQRDAAEFRARQAVLRSQPFVKEPRENWGQRFYADFSARDYCGTPGA